MQEEIRFELNLNKKDDFKHKIYEIYRLNEFKACQQFLKMFLEKYPDDTDMLCLQAVVGLKFSYTGDVLQSLLNFLQRPETPYPLESMFGLMKFHIHHKAYDKAEFFIDAYLAEIKEPLAKAYSQQAFILQSLAQYEKACEFYIKTLDTIPNPSTYCSLMSLLRYNQLFKSALTWAQKGLENFPQDLMILLEYAVVLRYCCDWRGEYIIQHELLDASLKEISENKLPVISPFYAVISIPDSRINYEIARQYAIEKKRYTIKLEEPFEYPKRKRKKIRIAYSSMSFRDHAVGRMMVDLYRYHDKENFEIYCYSLYPDNENDLFWQRIVEHCDSFNNVNLLSSIDIAKKIHADEIDILVDLDCYLAHNRMEIFTYRPAPIQINYLGFPGTSGGEFMDYIIADKIIIPEEQQQYYSEKVIYMPKCYQLYSDYTGFELPHLTRKELGLPEDKFIFTCFNMPHKIDEKSFNAWMRILAATPHSVLWLFTIGENKLVQDNWLAHAVENNIDPARLIFGVFEQKHIHLARSKLADLMLDSFICNAHSTATDALWSHLPVLTLQGEHFSSRVCSSLLNYVGLHDLVTYTSQEYEDKAIMLANNPEKLKEYRAILAKNVMKTLCNTALTVKHLEAAYRKIWDNYLAGNAPKTTWV